MTNARQGSLKTRGAPVSAQSQNSLSHTHSEKHTAFFFLLPADNPSLWSLQASSDRIAARRLVPPLCKLDYGNGEWTSDLNSAWLQISHVSNCLEEKIHFTSDNESKEFRRPRKESPSRFSKVRLRKDWGQDLEHGDRDRRDILHRSTTNILIGSFCCDASHMDHCHLCTSDPFEPSVEGVNPQLQRDSMEGCRFRLVKWTVILS